ncbi:MAG: phosphoribosyl-AMP cyclohydrolase [Leptospiraceae bacterium]|nr:phosphoribosyl-AMP cyclohydrolase [Leptospiraceae bacterium]MDW7976450.1 phosphoribosyl-AMP cyclohydrolase [Leptospiraceae bacterium]
MEIKKNFQVSINSIEEISELQLDFQKLQEVAKIPNIMPVIVQDIETKEVLMLAYVTPEALRKAIELKKAVFYSSKRKELWIKGETSGNYLELHEIRVNCEQNSLLYLVKPIKEGICHTYQKGTQKHRKTCYYRKIENEHLIFLKEYE